MRCRRLLLGSWITVALLVLAAVPVSAIVTPVSVNSDGVFGNNASWVPSISADGNLIAFMSLASNLVEGDTNGVRDIFVYNRAARTMVRVSVASDGTQANGDSWQPCISANGTAVAFSSDATNLIAGDTNGCRDVFVHALGTGQTERVSLVAGGGQANGPSREPCISSEGGVVGFVSDATNLVDGDTNGLADIFVYDRSTQGTERVSVGLAGAQANGSSRNPAISANGAIVAFDSLASNLVEGDTNGCSDVFLRERGGAGATVRISVGAGGKQANSTSQDAAINGDGRFVAFRSYATNLVDRDTNGCSDIFLRDLASGTTERASVGTGNLQGNQDSVDPAISRDGRFILFASLSRLITDDRDDRFDIYIRDQWTGVTQRVSSTYEPSSLAPNGHSWWPTVSDTGNAVAFWSEADNLVLRPWNLRDTNYKPDVFVAVPPWERGACTALTLEGGEIPSTYTWSVKVNLTGGDRAAGLDFTATFDPKVLQCDSVTNTAIGWDTVVTTDWSLQFNINNTEGWIKVSMATENYFTADVDGVVVYLNFTVSEDVVPGTATTIALSDAKLYNFLGWPLPLCVGVDIPEDFEVSECPHPADPNRDQAISVDDAILLLQSIVGLDKPTGWEWEWPLPVKCHDLNEDGVLDSGDAAIILLLVSMEWPINFPLPYDLWLERSASAASAGSSAVHLPQDRVEPRGAALVAIAADGTPGIAVSLPQARVDPGGTAIVPITVDSATGIAGADFTILYDPAVVEVAAVTKTNLTNGFYLGKSIDNEAGRLGIAVARATGIEGGSGALVNIEFRAVGQSGQTALDLTRCELFDESPSRIAVTFTDGSIRIAYATGFSDVPTEYWAADEIVACVDAGIVSGYPDATYRPDLAVTRDQMAVFIARALAGGDANIPAGPTAGHFSDVPPGHWAYRHVEYAYAEGVVEGYADNLYHPEYVVDRGQMAVFIARAIAGSDAAVPEPAGDPTFADVTPDGAWSWCYKHVEHIAAVGIAQGYLDGLYHPEYACARDQMAVFIARAFGLAQ